MAEEQSLMVCSFVSNRLRAYRMVEHVAAEAFADMALTKHVSIGA